MKGWEYIFRESGHRKGEEGNRSCLYTTNFLRNYFVSIVSEREIYDEYCKHFVFHGYKLYAPKVV